MTIDPEDIALLRAEGDLKAFLLSLAGRPIKRPVTELTPEPEPPKGSPGSWPVGTRPPAPTAPLPPEAWHRAVHEYRAWLAAGSPSGDFVCACGCTPISQRHRRAS
jgi:hypothetical protein